MDSGISVFTFVIRSLWLKVVEVFIQFFHCFLLPLSKTIKISENCEIFRKFFSVIVVVDVRRVRVVVFTERVLLTIIFNNQHASAEMVPQISGRIVYGQYRR